jgi:hypothetical protein
MPEHLIRLRGPWDLLDRPGPPDDRASRISLPTNSFPESDRPLILRRRFGRPALLDGQLACRLRAEHVPGLIRMTLNGEVLFEPAGEPRDLAGSLELDLEVGPLLKIRNVLELTVDPRPDGAGPAEPAWGSFALVFDDDHRPGG